jgi:hypothetical protein
MLMIVRVDWIVAMTNSLTSHKRPATTYDKPHGIVKDKDLSHHEKKEALNNWEQDARQLMTASNEGMPGPKEGLEPPR